MLLFALFLNSKIQLKRHPHKDDGKGGTKQNRCVGKDWKNEHIFG